MIVAYVSNSIFKHVLREPRPFWLDSSVGLRESFEYGLPSGHVQIGGTVYLFLAYWFSRPWVWLLSLILLLLMALSRIYLGVHFVHDAVAGAVLAALLLAAYWIWCRYFRESFRNRILGQRLLVAVMVPVGAALLYLILRVLIGQPSEAVAWSSYTPVAEVESAENVASALGMLLGIGVGFILEASRVHFTVAGPARKRALRYLLGSLVTVAIWRGLGLVLPAEPLWLGLPLRLFRYWLAGLWVAYYAPLIFVRVGLAEASPRPDVELQVSEGSIMRG